MHHLNTNRSLLVKSTVKKEKDHPCDEQTPCDPLEEPEGECPKPFLCQSKLKNPAYEGENTRCKPGAFINVKDCSISDPDHPCDGLVPCSVKGKTRNCQDPTLLLHRIKNPEVPKRPITNDCDPTK